MLAFKTWLTAGVCALVNLSAQAQQLCVFDVMGTGGDTYALMKDYALFSQSQGVKLELSVFTDEAEPLALYQSGQCEMMSSTSISARPFNRFVSTISAIGVVPTMEVANSAMRLVANPKLQHLMTNEQHEVAGMTPMGLVYMLINGTWFKSTADLHGRKVGYLKTDPSQEHAWERLGLKPVPLGIDNYAHAFNRGEIDVLPAPAMVIKPFELDKRLHRSHGKIIKIPLVFLTQTVVFNRKDFPSDFGNKSRQWFHSQIPRMMRAIQRIEQEIPKDLWQPLNEKDYDGNRLLMLQLRQRYLKEGVFDRRMDQILERIRCQQGVNETHCP